MSKRPVIQSLSKDLFFNSFFNSTDKMGTNYAVVASSFAPHHSRVGGKRNAVVGIF